MLDITQVKEKYPKAYSLLIEWTKRYLVGFQQLIMVGVEEDVELPTISTEMAEKAAEGMMSVNFRILYDFFDENKQYILITHFNVNGKFSFIINGKVTNLQFDNRTEAEIDAFDHAFENIEKL